MNDNMDDQELDALLRRGLTYEASEPPISGLAERAMSLASQKPRPARVTHRPRPQFHAIWTLVATAMIGMIIVAGWSSLSGILGSYESTVSDNLNAYRSGTWCLSVALIAAGTALAGLVAMFAGVVFGNTSENRPFALFA